MLMEISIFWSVIGGFQAYLEIEIQISNNVRLVYYIILSVTLKPHNVFCKIITSHKDKHENNLD